MYKLKIIIFICVFSIIIYFLERLISYAKTKGELFILKDGINDFCQKNKYEKLELKGILSDKYKVKKWLSENGFTNIKTAKVLYKTKNVNDIKNFNLPKDFVMKSTTGAGMTCVVKNNDHSKDELIKIAKEYLKITPHNYGYRKIPFLGLEEPQYKYNDPQIIFEEYLPGNGENTLSEFRILMIKGKIINYEYIHNKHNYYYEKTKKIILVDRFKNVIDEPMKIDTKLVDDFVDKFYQQTKIDFCRIDFYHDGKDFIFGELTFTPDNCRKSYDFEYEKNVMNSV